MPASEALSQRLRALEESLLQPDVRKSQQLVALLADEFIEFGTSGRVYIKADLVAVLRDEAPSTQTTSDFKVALLSPQVALLTYRIRLEATAGPHAAQFGLAASWRAVADGVPPGDADHGTAVATRPVRRLRVVGAPSVRLHTPRTSARAPRNLQSRDPCGAVRSRRRCSEWRSRCRLSCAR